MVRFVSIFLFAQIVHSVRIVRSTRMTHHFQKDYFVGMAYRHHLETVALFRALQNQNGTYDVGMVVRVGTLVHMLDMVLVDARQPESQLPLLFSSQEIEQRGRSFWLHRGAKSTSSEHNKRNFFHLQPA